MVQQTLSPTGQLLQLSQHRLERVLQINRELSATLDLQELLQSIVDAAAELTGSAQGAIAQFDASQNCLRFIIAPWMTAEQMQALRVPLEGSLIGQAFRGLAPVVTEDVQRHEAHYREVDKATRFQTRSMLAVPLAIQGKATGVLSAVNKQRGAFDQQDVYLMESLASQAAIAIQNAQLLRESREAYQALAQLEKLRSNFIAITSHELRIPLGLILGHATLMKEILEGEPREQARVIEKAALRLKDIVEDLSKIDSIENDRVMLRATSYDLAAQMRQLLATYAAMASQRGVELASRLPTEPLIIEGDAEKITVAIEHLLKNALAFTNPGGRVGLNLWSDGNWVAVQVTDTGIGIPVKDLPRIFDRFFQVEDHMTRKHGGMGVGLTVAKMMIELHGGEIQVDSVQGEGSRFTVHLPVALAKPALQTT